MNYLKTYSKLFKENGYNIHTNREPRFLFTVQNVVKSNIKTLIDIGTGHGSLLKILHKVNFQTSLTSVDLKNYHNLRYVSHIDADLTRIIDHEKIIGKYDVLSCLDCLEHFEEKYIRDILNLFSRLSDTFLFSIANHSDIIDGIELHLIQKESIWWSNILSEYFEIVYFESLYNNTLYLYKCKGRNNGKTN